MDAASAARRKAFAREATRRGVSTDALRLRGAFLRAPADWPSPQFRDGEAVSSAVERVVAALGLPDLDPLELRLSSEWGKIVGADLARRTTPGRPEGGVLPVYVRGAVWYSELKRTANRTLLPRVRAAAAPTEIREIRVLPANG
ncbi:MAG: DUF721 domain-containing protein [Kiritimatiellae bacterium]|nr:DUF721 domain-containing protein [Kiritimatiellia bacterium]